MSNKLSKNIILKQNKKNHKFVILIIITISMLFLVCFCSKLIYDNLKIRNDEYNNIRPIIIDYLKKEYPAIYEDINVDLNSFNYQKDCGGPISIPFSCEENKKVMEYHYILKINNLPIEGYLTLNININDNNKFKIIEDKNSTSYSNSFKTLYDTYIAFDNYFRNKVGYSLTAKNSINVKSDKSLIESADFFNNIILNSCSINKLNLEFSDGKFSFDCSKDSKIQKDKYDSIKEVDSYLKDSNIDYNINYNEYFLNNYSSRDDLIIKFNANVNDLSYDDKLNYKEIIKKIAYIIKSYSSYPYTCNSLIIKFNGTNKEMNILYPRYVKTNVDEELEKEINMELAEFFN